MQTGNTKTSVFEALIVILADKFQFKGLLLSVQVLSHKDSDG